MSSIWTNGSKNLDCDASAKSLIIYHANIAYPDDGSIVDGDVDGDFDFKLDIINNNDDGFEETKL